MSKTKKSLVLSCLSMLLCVTMLIGSTFAWFTDNASTGVNTIQAGTLDIELQMKDASGNWVTAEGKTLDFVKAAGAESEAILWEPGCTYNLPELRVVNNGTLALKYKVVITGIKGDAELNKAIDWTIDGEAINLTEQHLTAGAEGKAFTIKGHMQETAGNEYQGLSIEGISITVVATQYTHENDSTGNQYDKDAPLDFVPVANAAELATALAEGKSVSLTKDVALSDIIEVTGDITIQGNGNSLIVPAGGDRVINVNEITESVTVTLSGVDIQGPTSGTYTRGISFYGNKNITLVMDDCSVSANYYAVNIAGGNENVNVVIKNTTLTGWCAAQTWSANSNMTFENCTLIGKNDKTYNADGWNNFATFVVNVDAGGSVLNFNNCTIEANQTTGNVQNLISIRADSTINCNGCTFIVDGTKLNTVEEVLEHVDVNAGVTPTYSITNIK